MDSIKCCRVGEGGVDEWGDCVCVCVWGGGALHFMKVGSGALFRD